MESLEASFWSEAGLSYALSALSRVTKLNLSLPFVKTPQPITNAEWQVPDFASMPALVDLDLSGSEMQSSVERSVAFKIQMLTRLTRLHLNHIGWIDDSSMVVLAVRTCVSLVELSMQGIPGLAMSSLAEVIKNLVGLTKLDLSAHLARQTDVDAVMNAIVTMPKLDNVALLHGPE